MNSGSLESRILEKIQAGCTRDELVGAYREGILRMYDPGLPAPDWPTLNRSIIERWSRSGLEYIKNKAWQGVA